MVGRLTLDLTGVSDGRIHVPWGELQITDVAVLSTRKYRFHSHQTKPAAGIKVNTDQENFAALVHIAENRTGRSMAHAK